MACPHGLRRSPARDGASGTERGRWSRGRVTSFQATPTSITASPSTARAEVFDCIETFCNRRRLRKRKVVGYLTPAETRQRHQHDLAA
ncbi:hypothetical protein [Streptomyces sp. NPDC086787]|uniref:hypothetical protein n=1 Tax=Streptomyces sp. NPDC086787 TaxID=3365759 RepID=UPI0038107736